MTRTFTRRELHRLALVALFGTAAGCATAPTSNGDPLVLGWGFTHTQTSADHGSADAVSSVVASLRTQPLVQNQHIMGWGAGNPEPSPGVYDFTSLDSRVDFILKAGGLPVITLCGAPDWMKGGPSGVTDWSRLEAAPTPAHYTDFAALAAVVARRYPDVHHFVVWNEFKGFFDESTKKWDAPGYTRLYDAVYEAVKQVSTGNMVGGPYLDMAAAPADADPAPSPLSGPWGSVDPRTLDAFEYWSSHKRAADFVVVDGHAEVAGGPGESPIALEKFAAVSSWVRARTALPLWWSEWYVQPPAADWTPAREIAMRAAAMIALARAGVATTLYWNPPPVGDQSATTLWSATDLPPPKGAAPDPCWRFSRDSPGGSPRGHVSWSSPFRRPSRPCPGPTWP